MMKKTKLATLISALVWGAAVGTASAALAASDQSAARSPASFYSHTSVAELLARHGADDPQPPNCDDHGTDLCSAATLAKNGADDPQPPKCDDHGTDLCRSEA